MELRDGTWSLFEAGEVDVEVTERGVRVAAVRARPGWRVRHVPKRHAWRRGGRPGPLAAVFLSSGSGNVGLEVTYGGGMLEVARSTTTSGVEAHGVHRLGDAGEATFTGSGTLHAEPSAGWRVTSAEEDTLDGRTDAFVILERGDERCDAMFGEGESPGNGDVTMTQTVRGHYLPLG